MDDYYNALSIEYMETIRRQNDEIKNLKEEISILKNRLSDERL